MASAGHEKKVSIGAHTSFPHLTFLNIVTFSFCCFLVTEEITPICFNTNSFANFFASSSFKKPLSLYRNDELKYLDPSSTLNSPKYTSSSVLNSADNL